LNPCKRFWGVSIRKNWIGISSLSTASSRNKWK
jgi:hypothetical protein